jgi:hypothetical protein
MTCIKNCDGTPYKLTNSLDTFDPKSQEHFLLNSFDSELIQIAGTPILYYELFIQRQTIDYLYREDRGKIWSTSPVTLRGYYEPIPSQNYLNMFGIDAPDEVQFLFNYRDVLKAIGHPPKLGSRIYSVQKGENWEIMQRNVGEFFLWGELRLVLITRRFQESVTTGEGRVVQKNVSVPTASGSMPIDSIKINQGALLGDNPTNNNNCNNKQG